MQFISEHEATQEITFFQKLLVERDRAYADRLKVSTFRLFRFPII
jgi:hypothetical protein